MSEVNMWAIEEELYAQGYEVICGVDEAGRGPLAGPVCAAAVILPPDFYHPLLNDSKQMSEKNRYALREIICKELKLTTLGYQSIAGLIEAIGLPEDCVCTYCWNGKG